MWNLFYLLSIAAVLIAAGLTWLWWPAVVLLIIVLGAVLVGIHGQRRTGKRPLAWC
jgi:Flp pilus assembly protein TadB